MPYPDNVINEGEVVAVDVRPHWWYLAGPVALAVLCIAGAIAAAVSSVTSVLQWIAVVVMVAAVGWLVVRYIRWVTTRLVVTNARIIERRGVFARQGREIPLSALSNIGYHQSFFERIIGAGNVVLESAGKDSAEVFPDLPHPAQIHNEIYRQREQAQHSAGGPPLAAPSAPSAPAAASIPEQIEQLDALRQRGVITDAEFQAKKAELLDRL